MKVDEVKAAEGLEFEVVERTIGFCFRTLLPFGLSSPTLPLPVELVAGGEGKPEPIETLGLGGGSGRSGVGRELVLESRDPMKIADKGRCCLVRANGRRDIGLDL